MSGSGKEPLSLGFRSQDSIACFGHDHPYIIPNVNLGDPRKLDKLPRGSHIHYHYGIRSPKPKQGWFFGGLIP